MFRDMRVLNLVTGLQTEEVTCMELKEIYNNFSEVLINKLLLRLNCPRCLFTI
jgi:hypothetical protein